jgi:hypothetical protein
MIPQDDCPSADVHTAGTIAVGVGVATAYQEVYVLVRRTKSVSVNTVV